MATKLFLRDTKDSGIGIFRDMLIAAGSGVAPLGQITTVSGGTEIQWKNNGQSEVLEWISGRVPAGGFTLSSTVTFSAWCRESNMNANCGARGKIFKRTAAGVESLINTFNDGVEFGTSAAEMVWTGTATSTAFAEDDRIIVRLYITNIGTMGNNFTCELDYGSQDATQGDSFFQITQNVTFKAEPVNLVIQGATQAQSPDGGAQTLMNGPVMSAGFDGNQNTGYILSNIGSITDDDVGNGHNMIALYTSGTSQLVLEIDEELLQSYFTTLSITGTGSGTFNSVDAISFTASGGVSQWIFTTGLEFVEGGDYTLTMTKAGTLTLEENDSSATLVTANGAQAQTSDNLAITQEHSVIVDNGAQAQTSDNIAIVQQHNVTVDGATQAQMGDNVAISQQHVLSVNGGTQAQISDNTVLVQQHTVSISNGQHDQTSENVILVQQHALAVGNADQTQIADNLAVTIVYQLESADAVHTQTADNVSIDQAQVLGTDNANHAQTSGNIQLGQVHVLAANSADQAQLSDNAVLTQQHILSAQNGQQDQAADNVAVTVSGDLIVQESGHAHVADNVNIEQTHVIITANGQHDQISQNLALVQVHVLSQLDALHPHTPDNVILTQLHTLITQEAIHAQTADEPTVGSSLTLALQNVIQAQIADNLAITQEHLIAIQDAISGQLVDDVLITQIHVLVVDDAIHQQIGQLVLINYLPDEQRTLVLTAKHTTYILVPMARVVASEQLAKILVESRNHRGLIMARVPYLLED